MAHKAFENDIDALSQSVTNNSNIVGNVCPRVRELVDYLPLSNRDNVPTRFTSDPRYSHTPTTPLTLPPSSNRQLDGLDYIIPHSSDQPYNMLHVVEAVFDEGNFYEIMPDYARNIVVGFARLGGRTVGVVGNQPNHKAGEARPILYLEYTVGCRMSRH